MEELDSYESSGDEEETTETESDYAEAHSGFTGQTTDPRNDENEDDDDEEDVGATDLERRTNLILNASYQYTTVRNTLNPYTSNDQSRYNTNATSSHNPYNIAEAQYAQHSQKHRHSAYGSNTYGANQNQQNQQNQYHNPTHYAEEIRQWMLNNPNRELPAQYSQFLHLQLQQSQQGQPSTYGDSSIQLQRRLSTENNQPWSPIPSPSAEGWRLLQEPRLIKQFFKKGRVSLQFTQASFPNPPKIVFRC